MDILDGLLTLISGEIAGPPTGWVNMASTTQSACHNYKLEATANCGTLPAKTLYIQIPAFEPIKYKEASEGFENANNENIKTWRRVEPVILFTIVGTAETHNDLEIIASHCMGGTVTFTKIIGADYVANVKSLKVTPSLDDALTRLEVELEFKDAGTETSICCGSYYDGAPFNECDGEGETGDPSNDPDCVGFAVAIDYTTGPELLTASLTGGGVGTPVYTWYLNDVLFGSGVSVVPTLAGVYRVDVQLNNCNATQEITYNLPCTDFEVLTNTLVMGDGTTVLIALPNLLTTLIQWQELIAAVWTDIPGETELIYQPDHTGSYRVRGVAVGGCEDESAQVDVTVEVEVDCEGLFTVELTNVDGDLTATVSDYAGAEEPTFEWFGDTGSGYELLPWTGSTIPDAPPGYYSVIVTLEGCALYANILVTCIPVTDDSGCPPGSNYQEFLGTGTEVAFHVTNFTLPDPAFLSNTEINSAVMVVRDTAVQLYDATPLYASQFSIDYASQEVRINASFPLEAGSILRVYKIH